MADTPAEHAQQIADLAAAVVAALRRWARAGASAGMLRLTDPEATAITGHTLAGRLYPGEAIAGVHAIRVKRDHANATHTFRFLCLCGATGETRSRQPEAKADGVDHLARVAADAAHVTVAIDRRGD